MIKTMDYPTVNRYHVKAGDKLEIPKEKIIHTRVVLQKDTNEKMLEIWYIE